MVPQQQRRRRRRAALVRTTERRVFVARGTGGFGFTIAGQRPCVVSAVASGGPAERAGLRAGDALLAVDGASVARAPHASVARLIAAAPSAIALSVAPRDSPPTDTEDTEPDERARTRRRHPPPRRRPQPAMLHHPACHAAPSTSGVNEILQNISRAQLTPNHVARLECRAVVGYLGTIETPQATSNAAPGNVRTAVRKLRQERRPATPILLCVLPNALLLRRPSGQVLAQYQRDRIVFSGSSSEADRRYFGLVTSAELSDNDAEASHSSHIFAVDPRMAEHEAHITRAQEFQITCTRDPVAERCLEFPPSAEYVVGVIRGMYSLPAEECNSPALQQISKLAVKGDSPVVGNFSRCNRAMFRPRERRCRHEEARFEGQEFVANSPQPSNHSEVTTTSSNSDSGIGFHNDGRNVADRILVVDFAGQQPQPNRFRVNMPRRPIGLVGCNFEDGSFLSNTTPVVDGFGGQGRPLNLDDVILNSNDLQIVRHVSPRNEEDNYNYNNIYGNIPSSSRTFSNGVLYDHVCTENEQHQYELIPSHLDIDLDIDRVAETFNSVEIYEERPRQPPDYQSNESVENVTVISRGTSKASMDSVSVYSSRSHEEARPSRRKHLQASLDDMLVLGLRDPPPAQNKNVDDDDAKFLHPSTVKYKIRKSRPLNLLSKTKHMLSGKDKERKQEGRSRALSASGVHACGPGSSRALSASAGDVCGVGGRDRALSASPGERPNQGEEHLSTAASEPDLRQSEQASPFRRWTTGNGTGSSYRHHDPRNMYNKQMSEGSHLVASSVGNNTARGGVAGWSLGLDHLLADPAGYAAFAYFLEKEIAAENIRFWCACEKYSKCESAKDRASLKQHIWQTHLSEVAAEPVNIDAAAKRATALRLDLDPPPKDLFEQAQRQIFNVMKFDSYQRFLKSEMHGECARADLRGVPLPYPPAPNTHNQNGAVCHLMESPKLKKSASNASERRRSGGALLLPWRSRNASRDRNNSPSPTPTPTPTTTSAPGNILQADNDTLSCPYVLGEGRCRVELPNSVKTVVNVDENETVRQLIDRLLSKRNMHCPSYDVVLKDPNGSSSESQSSVELRSSSCVLGGREVRVKRRCVLRVEVGGRCLTVRCRPGCTLEHVLRPVLAKYCTPETHHHHASQAQYGRAGITLATDTLVQDVDGGKLRVLMTEEGKWVVEQMDPPPARVGAGAGVGAGDRDADSVSELAVRLHDDRDADAQSGISGSSRSECGSGYGAAGGGAAGRVRAALLAGPPMHRHPPDFLENLRDTQRIRLTPRSPPPLPPKPANRRQPTLV